MTSLNDQIKPPGQEFTIHCPKLGHQLPFSYCRSENMGVPCFKCLDCWFCYFPVERYLRSELAAEEWSEVFEKPRTDKVAALVDLIAKAKTEKE